MRPHASISVTRVGDDILLKFYKGAKKYLVTRVTI